MKIFFLLTFFLFTNLYSFRLIKLTTTGNVDLAKFLVKWDKKTLTIGTGIDSSFPSALSYCSNIEDAHNSIEEIIEIINNISEADIELIWGGSTGTHDINIYSYSQTEWNTHNSTWNKSANTLGFTSFDSAPCYENYECYFSQVIIRLNCSTLGNPPSSTNSDFKSVVLHETIHGLGLDHTEGESALMYPSISIGSTRRKIHSDDEAGIIFLYPKNDGPRFFKGLVCGRIQENNDFSILYKLKHLIYLLILLSFVSILKYFNKFNVSG